MRSFDRIGYRATMSGTAVQQFESHSRRRASRANTFLMATLVSDTFSAPVRIKNISAHGALLSGPDLPRVGETCRLRRAELSVSGRIVRTEDSFAAIQFAREINVHQWIGATTQLPSDIDRIVQAEKHRYPVADSSHRIAAITNHEPARLAPPRVTAEELLDLADQLDRLANSLSDDPRIIAEYQTRLQVLDIASQRLRAFGKG